MHSKPLHCLLSILESLDVDSAIGKEPLAALKTPLNTLVKSLPRPLRRQFEYPKVVNFKLLALVENGSQSHSKNLHRLSSIPEWLEMENARGKELLVSLKMPLNTLKSSPRSLGRQFELIRILITHHSLRKPNSSTERLPL